MNHQRLAKGSEIAAPALTPLIGSLLVAVGGVITAWATLSARFQRVQRLDTETQGAEKSFRFLYVMPQILNGLVFLALVLIAIMAVVGGLMSSAVPNIKLAGGASTFGQIAVGFYDLGWWVVILGVAAGGIAVIDLFARIAVGLTRTLSWLPIPGLEGLFGPDGQSLGWLQAREFIRAGPSALPLAITRNGIDRVVGAVLGQPALAVGGEHRAPTPEGTPAARGNIALFGCVMEQLEVDLGVARRRWDKFYGALGKANQDASFFEPAKLAVYADGTAFYTALRAAVDPVLSADNEAILPASLPARETLEHVFNRLKDKFGCDVTRMATRRPLPFHSKAFGLSVRARRFPKLEDDRMCPQFIKLCLRWDVVPLISGDRFTPAFSSGIGWYMLDAGALAAPQDMKTIPFRGPMNQPAVRIAEMRVIKVIVDRLEKVPDEAPGLQDAVKGLGASKRRWQLEQEVDTALWGLTRTALVDAKAAGWKDHRWKLDDMIATRT